SPPGRRPALTPRPCRSLSRGARPDALVCFNDQLALGALRALHEHGVRVPEEVAVIGFDDVEGGRFSVPTLSTVAPDKAAVARTAVQLLQRRIDAAPAGHRRAGVERGGGDSGVRAGLQQGRAAGRARRIARGAFRLGWCDSSPSDDAVSNPYIT
ncbi:substrate-binding domain-containing protein, partial [Streptomyces sp. NPDC057428]|uniref:substrate-binding domain-containing protein n=1 Tax=Streptomyces sp. NPDC057428 TaxID=3346129 RepID=UPI0036C67265